MPDKFLLLTGSFNFRCMHSYIFIQVYYSRVSEVEQPFMLVSMFTSETKLFTIFPQSKTTDFHIIPCCTCDILYWVQFAQTTYLGIMRTVKRKYDDGKKFLNGKASKGFFKTFYSKRKLYCAVCKAQVSVSRHSYYAIL